MAAKAKSGIYEIVNTFNGKRYVGSAVNVRQRWNVHRHMLSHGTHHSPYLQSAWRKYGSEAFEFRVIERCSVESLIEFEQRYFDRLSPEYNIAPKAGSCLGVRWSDEARAKHSVRQKANPTFKGRKHSAETIDRMRQSQTGKPSPTKGCKRQADAIERTAAAHRGRKRSDETRRKIAEKAKGRPFVRHDETYREKLSAAFKGKAKSPEHMAALQAGRAKRVYTDEQRAAMSEAGKRSYEEGRRSRDRSPEYRAKIAATLRERAKDPAVREQLRRQAIEQAARKKALS